MRTATILLALEYSNRDQRIYYNLLPAPYYETLFERRIRQSLKFNSALLSRLEVGDRARDTLDKLAETVGPDLLIRATFGEVTDTERAIAGVLDKYFEELQP